MSTTVGGMTRMASIAGLSGIETGEPARMTLFDLCATVAGFGVAFVLPTRLGSILSIGPTSDISVFLWIDDFVMAMTKAVILALMPVILARRLRYGGTGRAAEWLVLTIVANETIWLFLEGGGLLRGWWNRWSQAGLVLFAASAGLLVFARTSFRGIMAVVLLFVLLLSWFWGPASILSGSLQDAFFDLSYGGYSKSLTGMVAFGLVSAPSLLVTGLFLAAAASDLIHPRRRRLTWLQWAGFASVVTCLVASCLELPINIARYYPASYTLKATTIHLLGWSVTFALAWLLWSKLGTCWSRWLGLDYHRPLPPSPLEA